MDTSFWDNYEKERRRQAHWGAVVALLVTITITFACGIISFFSVLAVSSEEIYKGDIIAFLITGALALLFGFLSVKAFIKYREAKYEAEATKPAVFIESTIADFKRKKLEKTCWRLLFWFLILAIFAIVLVFILSVFAISGPKGEGVPTRAFWITTLSLSAIFFFLLCFFEIRIRRKFWQLRSLLDGVPPSAEIFRKKTFSKKTAMAVTVIMSIISLLSCFVFAFLFSPAKMLRNIVSQIGRTELQFEPLIHPKHEEDFSEGLAAVKMSDLFGYIDKSGNIVIDPRFNSASPFYEGLALVEVDGKAAFIDRNGEIVIEPRCDHAWPFSGGMAMIEVDNKYGFIDRTGQIVIKPRFPFATSFSEGLACVRKGEKFGFIDAGGGFAIEPTFWSATIFKEGKACVQYDNNDYRKIIWEYDQDNNEEPAKEIQDNIVAGYIDHSGGVLIAPEYEFGWPFCDGLAQVYVDGRRCFIDETGQITIAADAPGLIDSQPAFFFHESMLMVWVGDKKGFIDRSGKLAVQARFDSESDFSEGLAAVKVNDKWGYIDKTGNLVIQPIFDEAEWFSEGLAYVETGQISGYIDASGRMVIELPQN